MGGVMNRLISAFLEVTILFTPKPFLSVAHSKEPPADPNINYPNKNPAEYEPTRRCVMLLCW